MSIKRIALPLLCLCAVLLAGCSGVSGAVTDGALPAQSQSQELPLNAPPKTGLWVNGENLPCEPVLVIDGEEIDMELYRHCYLTAKAEFENLYGQAVWDNPDSTLQLRERVEKSLLNTVAYKRMAQQNGIALSDADYARIDEQLAAVQSRYADEAEYAAVLAQSYLTPDLFRRLLITQTLNEKTIAALYGDEIREHADEEFFCVQHIYATGEDAEQTIQKAADALQNGMPFEEAMQLYSADQTSYVQKSGTVQEDYEQAVKKLDFNEVSGVVKTENGCYIIRRLPIPQAYYEENLLNLMGDATYAKVQEDLQGFVNAMPVQRCKYYARIAPDTLL